MTLEVRSNSTPNVRIPPARLASVDPKVHTTNATDSPLRAPAEASDSSPVFSLPHIVSDFELPAPPSIQEDPRVDSPTGSTDEASFLDKLSDLADRIPKPIRDLIGDGLDKVGGKIKDMIFGRGEKDDVKRLDSGAVSRSDPRAAGSRILNLQADSFEATIGALLRPNAEGAVHEEELFASLVSERLNTTVSPDAAKAYQTALQERIGALTRPDGSVPVEQAAIEALKQVRDQGLVTPQQADQVYSQAFAAAQLDGNTEALFDDRGSDTDPTIATGDFAQALASAKEKVAAFDSGAVQAPSRSLEEAAPTGGAQSGQAGAAGQNSTGEGTSPETGRPEATPADRPAGTRPGATNESAKPNPTERKGFLWKPESDKDGKLVVLLPTELAKDARSVIVRDVNGDVVASGKPSGIGNGNRAHFRFDRSGRDFEGPVTVEATLVDGSTRNFRVKDPARRFERQPT